MRKRNYFTEYGELARKGIDSLLDKYADEGPLDVENPEIITLDPTRRLGTAPEIIRAFGGKPDYDQAINTLISQLYKVAYVLGLTNLLFFQKGTATKEIWYYEHRLPEGQKSYSKTKNIRFDEFAPMIEWWDKRKENEVAWRVRVEDLKEGFDLDVKNPRQPQTEKQYSSAELLDMLHQSFAQSDALLAQLRTALKE